MIDPKISNGLFFKTKECENISWNHSGNEIQVRLKKGYGLMVAI